VRKVVILSDSKPSRSIPPALLIHSLSYSPHRVIYAYFMNVELTEIPHLTFKPHVLYAMNPTPFSTNVSEIKLL